MSETKIQSGDFLSDVEIKILIRSGRTDLSELKKLIQVIVTSVTSLVDTKVVTTEYEEKINQTPERTLRIVSRNLFID